MPKVIELEYPVTYTRQVMPGADEKEEITVSKIELPDRLTGEHMIAMDDEDGPVAKQFALVSAAAGIPRDVVRKMDFADLATVNEHLNALRGKSPATGGS